MEIFWFNKCKKTSCITQFNLLKMTVLLFSMLKHSYTTCPIAFFCSIIHVIYFRPENRGTKAQERKDGPCQWFFKFFYFACVQCWKGQTRLYANNTTFRPTNVCVDIHSHQQTESHSQAYSYPTHSHGHTNTWWASHTHMHVAYKSYHTYIHIYFKEDLERLNQSCLVLRFVNGL